MLTASDGFFSFISETLYFKSSTLLFPSSSSFSRTIITSIFSFSSNLLISFAISRLISFSFAPLIPTFPESLPPCPLSRTTVCFPVRASAAVSRLLRILSFRCSPASQHSKMITPRQIITSNAPAFFRIFLSKINILLRLIL